MMAAGDLIIDDYQFEYNNILFGSGTNFDVMSMSDFLGFPSVRSSTADAFGRHGAVRGRHYVPHRTFTAEIRIVAQAESFSYAEMKSLIGHAFAVRTHPSDEIPFVYQLPGQTKRYINCRPIDLAIPLDREFSLQYAKAVVRFEASDPRHYQLAVKTEVATLPSPGDGLNFPLTFPLNFGVGSSNSIDVSNDGDAPAHWIGRVTGPAKNPRIEATSNVTGETLYLAFQNLTIVEGEELVLDSRDRSIRLNGQNRRHLLIPGSIWWSIPQHPDILTLHYTSSDDPGTASTFTIEWSDATWGN